MTWRSEKQIVWLKDAWVYCQGVDYQLKLKERPIGWKSHFEMLIFTIFAHFVYFPCISDKFNFSFTFHLR